MVAWTLNKRKVVSHHITRDKSIAAQHSVKRHKSYKAGACVMSVSLLQVRTCTVGLIFSWNLLATDRDTTACTQVCPALAKQEPSAMGAKPPFSNEYLIPCCSNSLRATFPATAFDRCRPVQLVSTICTAQQSWVALQAEMAIQIENSAVD